MNLQEARTILGVSEDTSPEEAKKKYKELAKKYHPDVNKEPDAEERFKKFNEAYQCVSTGQGTDPIQSDFGQGFNPFGNVPFNPFMRQQQTVHRVEHIQINETISFKDSILGIKKDLKYSRRVHCPECSGQGKKPLSNGCSKCNGLGTIITQKGNMIFTTQCDKCYGNIRYENCKHCKSTGSVQSDMSIQVQIPGGVCDGNVLRLSGIGNFVSNFMGDNQYSDAYLRVTVTPMTGLKLEGDDVVSTIDISLLDAVKGCKQSVETILGSKEIEIPKESKHKEEILIPNVGVNGHGNQRVILNVQYPKNTDLLINALTEETN